MSKLISSQDFYSCTYLTLTLQCITSNSDVLIQFFLTGYKNTRNISILNSSTIHINYFLEGFYSTTSEAASFNRIHVWTKLLNYCGNTGCVGNLLSPFLGSLGHIYPVIVTHCLFVCIHILLILNVSDRQGRYFHLLLSHTSQPWALCNTCSAVITLTALAFPVLNTISECLYILGQLGS